MHVQLQGWGSEFDRLFEQMWRVMRQTHTRDIFRCSCAACWRPRVNLYETGEAFLVCVELAGMLPEQMDVQADQRTLRIRGTRPKPAVPSESEVSVHLMEIDSGPFEREIPMPADVLVDRISARARHGFLWIILPRLTPVEGTTST